MARSKMMSPGTAAKIKKLGEALPLLKIETEDELYAAYSLCYDRYSAKIEEKDWQESKKWRRGEKVEFQNKQGQWIKGTIRSVNTRSLSITPEGQAKGWWRVAYAYVRRAA